MCDRVERKETLSVSTPRIEELSVYKHQSKTGIRQFYNSCSVVSVRMATAQCGDSRSWVGCAGLMPVYFMKVQTIYCYCVQTVQYMDIINRQWECKYDKNMFLSTITRLSD